VLRLYYRNYIIRSAKGTELSLGTFCLEKSMKKKHKCKGCVWGTKIGNKVVCMFAKCVKDTIK